MLNKLDIINSALISLGASPVQNTDESAAGQAAEAFWRVSLVATLRTHPWNFAIRRRVLAPLADAPAFGYSRAFMLPSDWIRTISTDADDYKQESGMILCDQNSLSLRYVAFVEDPARFDALFSDALAAYLSVKLAVPLTQSASQMDICWKAYQALLKAARSVDAQEDPPDEFDESSLLTARG